MNNQITLRQHYAGLAMQGYLAQNTSIGYQEAAEQSVRHADALLAALALGRPAKGDK